MPFSCKARQGHRVNESALKPFTDRSLPLNPYGEVPSHGRGPRFNPWRAHHFQGLRWTVRRFMRYAAFQNKAAAS